MGAKATTEDTSIKLTNKGIVEVESVKNFDLLFSFTKLRTINLKGNKITSLPPKLLRNLSSARAVIENLTTINLSHNRLKQVPNAFFLLVNVKCLHLNHNLLQSIPIRLAATLYQLEVLGTDVWQA